MRRSIPRPAKDRDWERRLPAGTRGPARCRRSQSATFADAHSDHWQALRSIPILLLTRQGLLFLRGPHALRWRLETFGLYMPSYPEARPWWRVNRRALAAFARQLPAYTRWLGGMHALRHGGAHGYWAARTGTGAREWEAWLDIAEGDDLMP